MSKFEELGIIQPILKAIEEERFEEPTLIQTKTIPLVIEGKDVIAGSSTGSGKTLAFGSGIIDRCEKGKGIQSLVLTPTRELAEQVSQALKRFSKHKPLNILAIYGGVSINPQIDNLHRADVVVGTPGRILDHLERNTINLRKVKILVLDEADRMLDMGFLEDVEKIISQCPRERQTLLFSATISTDIHKLSRRYMKDPVKISAETYVDPSKLKQVYYDINNSLKFSLLVHLLKKEHAGLIMVFSNTRRNTDFVAKNLRKNKLDAIPIHGGLSQDKRNKTISCFHSGKACVLVCTDVAARGLDIKGVSHVYNYDMPADSKEYIHRIGRTARAGKEGIVINLISERDHENFGRILRDNDIKIEKVEKPHIERVQTEQESRPRRGGFHRGPSQDRRFGNRGPGQRRGPSHRRSNYRR